MLGGGGLVLWALTRQSDDSNGGGEVNPLQFINALPMDARPYAEDFQMAGKDYGLDPFQLAAIAEKESRFGLALKPPGPGGTGDFTPRTWTPFPMPPDGLGWGRGLMQIDYYSNLDWLNGHDWRNPLENIRRGAKILREKYNYFRKSGNSNGVVLDAKQAARRGVSPGTFYDPRPLEGETLVRAALAAYNGGQLYVLQSIAAGLDPDFTTSGGHYGSNVLAAAQRYGAAYVAGGGVYV